MDEESPQARPKEDLFSRQLPPNTQPINPLKINRHAASQPGQTPYSPKSSDRAPYPPSINPPLAPTANTAGRSLPHPDDHRYQNAANGRAQVLLSPLRGTSSASQTQNGRYYTNDGYHTNNAAGALESQISSSPVVEVGNNESQRIVGLEHKYAQLSFAGTSAPPQPAKFQMHSQKPLPDSPGPDLPIKSDDEGLYDDDQIPSTSHQMFHARKSIYPVSEPASASTEFAHQYYGHAEVASPGQGLVSPHAHNISRLPSTTSVNTTRASRGSPPPSETPEGTYVGKRTDPDPGVICPAPPQTPLNHQGFPQPAEQHSREGPDILGQSPIEREMGYLRLRDEPPPAYAPQMTQANSTKKDIASSHPPKTQTEMRPSPNLESHPAFTNAMGRAESVESIPDPVSPLSPQQRPGSSNSQISQTSSTVSSRPIPPPLPEGWIAHIDPNSGQYYYIHLATSSTQWEFPKGPTPLNMVEPQSPTSTYIGSSMTTPTVSLFNFAGKTPLGSPGYPPQDALYRQHSLSMSSMSSPTAVGFSTPPPTSGIEQYRVAPTNGVYFGPYLRYTNMDVDKGVWHGSILIITDTPHPPTIHIHQSVDLSPDPRQLKANPIHKHRNYTFYRYDIDLSMQNHDTRWTYAITSHLGCTRYEFLVASKHETSWRFIAHSGNDFAMNVNTNERAKIGGIGYMWKDILQKHQDVGGFHAQLGMGNQIFADRLWKDIPSLRQWNAISGKDNKKNTPWTAQLEGEVSHAYFHYYTSHLDQSLLREAFAQIPHVLTLDDHEIFDGYGSYPDHLQSSAIFRNIGRIGTQTYLLFQHHTTPTILQTPINHDFDIFTITGTGWHFVKYLGPAVVIVGPDCRSERTPHQVLAASTYQGLFPKIAMLPPAVQHCVWMIPVPVIYPRLDTAESLAQTISTAKKTVTGTFNVLGKVTSSVASIVGAKSVVGDGFSSLKKAVGKSGLMSGVLSPFGELDILDELRDQWTHESKDLERTYLIRTLQGIAKQKSLRMTFLSGSTNCCGAGLVHDPARPLGHKSMYQIVSSAVVNAPPSPYVLRLLGGGGGGIGGTSGGGGGGGVATKPLYVPINGRRSGPDIISDTKEDMLEIFGMDVDGRPRDGGRRLMGRRNYVAIVAFDPEAVKEGFAGSSYAGSTYAGTTHSGSSATYLPIRSLASDVGSGRPPGRLSLAVDFMVQAEGLAALFAQSHGYGAGTVKYGPVVIPAVEYGW